MKLLMAIVNDDDAAGVAGALTKAKMPATKLATTGGFLKVGNTTFIIGIENDMVDTALEIIGSHARKRTQIVQDTSPYGGYSTMAMPLEITVGGATVFVLDVERYEKL